MIFDLFSKKQKRIRGEVPDVYTYNDIPDKLRVQIVHIIQDTIGIHKNHYGDDDKVRKAYQFFQNTLCREYGKFFLVDKYNSPDIDVLNFFLQTEDFEQAIDVIDLIFKYIEKIIGGENYQKYLYCTQVKMRPEQAIEELNHRFKEHGIGYQFEEEIIRVDSTYAHSEIVKPTLTLLRGIKFKGANDEYLKAHEHYRHGRNKECLTDCLKAFESVLKIICKEKAWAYNQTDTSKKLIQICLQNNLIPNFTQNQFTSLQSLLESGIPTIRNKLGGHGQGQIPQKVDDEMTRYALNLTGSNIIFLIEQSGL
ncbi:hypothetical protein CH372_17275 [Leptospira meyeri]|uniref:STM4504/CBY_0614 family protein n=1 Tax=Leptospira meyeri TaxID=29508 RepID=UPI000C29A6E1|nr:hypothetical protein [Leptospira meyeri]PKA10834.1 hypothetical protein CH372_17275 [Leptospira meyeri]PKA23949.1 hypothetical protein CH381_23110 [Leptospira sp. mixed culture ATI2-C-A1]